MLQEYTQGFILQAWEKRCHTDRLSVVIKNLRKT